MVHVYFNPIKVVYFMVNMYKQSPWCGCGPVLAYKLFNQLCDQHNNAQSILIFGHTISTTMYTISIQKFLLTHNEHVFNI